MSARLDLTREQILGSRRRAGALDGRQPSGESSLRRAAWAGLQDSMPRAAVLSLHARVEETAPDVLDDPALVQVWGPRSSAYVVAAEDVAVFTLGRLATGGAKRRRAEETALRLAELLAGGGRMPYGEAGRSLGVDPNMLRYAAPTGTVLIRWDGARQPLIWSVPPPRMEESEARRELARRYLHVSGPSTAEAFSHWAGVGDPFGVAVFEELDRELVQVRTPVGDGVILAADEDSFRGDVGAAAPARLLPSGDAYYLRWGAERDLLVPDADHRDELWTSRVWPGAVLVEGELVGTWRRAQHRVTITSWRRLPTGARQAVEAEATALPLPGIDRGIDVRWDS